MNRNMIETLWSNQQTKVEQQCRWTSAIMTEEINQQLNNSTFYEELKPDPTNTFKK